MVPAGEGLTPFLMEGTADATVWAVSASGVPVYREGLGFMLPTGRWSVVEACSGLRYVIAAGVLSSLFAYLNFGRTRTRVVFIAAALAVALVANWIRAYLIVMIGHLSGMRLGVGDDHVWYGWAFFGLTMFVVFWMGARWKEPSEGSSALPTSAGGERRGDVSPASTGGDRWMRQLPALAAVCTVGLAPLVLGALQDTQPLVDVGARVQASLNGPIEQGEPLVVPRFSGATATIQGILDPGHATDGYLAYYARQQRGSELITFGNSVLQSDDPNWRIASTSVGSIGFGSGNVRFREWIVRSKGADRLLWSWYTVGGREAAGEMGTKGLTAWAVLTGRGDHSTVTVLGTRIEQSGEGPVNPDALEAARRRLGSEMPGWVAGARMATGRR
jgi:EpsI family protein